MLWQRKTADERQSGDGVELVLNNLDLERPVSDRPHANSRVLDREEPSLEDEQLIRQMTAHHSALRAFVFTLLPKADQVDEVLQNTHVEMWLKKQSFTPGTNFLAWACRIAHFKVLEFRGALARDHLVFDDELLEQVAADSEQYHVETSAQSALLEDCLAALPVWKRELIELRYSAGHSVKKLAEDMKRSADSLSVTLFRIRKAVLECIERKLSSLKR